MGPHIEGKKGKKENEKYKEKKKDELQFEMKSWHQREINIAEVLILNRKKPGGGGVIWKNN